MNKFTHLLKFVQKLFDEQDKAQKASVIIKGILKTQSPRMSDIAREMSGKEERVCRYLERWKEQRILAVSPGNTLSWTSYSLTLCE